MIVSVIIIGFGGFVGVEVLIVLIGLVIGFNLGSVFKMEYKILMLLVGCGVVGVVVGIFKVFIVGLVFILEVLMIDLMMVLLLFFFVFCVMVVIVFYIFIGFDVMFKFYMDELFLMECIFLVILLGIVCGLVFLYFMWVMNFVENIFC